MNEHFVLKKNYENLPANATTLLRNSVFSPIPPRHFNKILIAVFGFYLLLFTSVKVSAQFCQTWSLAASPSQTAVSGAATTGNTELIGSGMSAATYGSGYQIFPKPGGVNWPSVVNTASGIYLEFPVTPASGNNLVINSITFSAYENNGSGTRLIANLYNGTTATGVTADITSTTSGTPTNVSMTGLSIPVANGSTAPIRFYITGNNSRTLNIQNVVICGTSAAAFCADATLTPGTTVSAGNIGNGTTNNILTNFSIGATTNLNLTNYSFPFTNAGLVAGDLVNYKFWYSATNSFASAAVLSTVTTGLATSPINFGGFNQLIASGSAGYFWVTADIAAGATSGHSITASAFTPANLTFSGSPTTCGSVTAQGTKTITVLTAPTVTTTAATGITSTTATTGGNITSDGGSPITQSGLIYSTSPITDINSTTGGGIVYNAVNGTGTFTTPLTGLQPNTTYYVKAFAVNAAGITYATTQTFTTPPTPARNCGSSGVLDGSAAKEGTFYLYGYVKAGEKLDWDVFRTDDGSAANWTISVYTPTGLYSTCVIGNTIGNQCTTAQITATAGQAGIWTLVATPSGTNGNDVVCPALNVYTAAGVVIPGRVWTESLHGHDNSTGVEPDFTLYFLTPGGYKYSATYSGLNGLNYTIVSDSLGVRTAAGSCTSAYQSVSYTGASSPLGPDAANCGEKNKIFFQDFATDLPVSAPRFNVVTGTGQVTETLLVTPVVPSLTIPKFTRLNNCSSAGNIVFTVTNFTEAGNIYIDVNDNGIFTDPEDRMLTATFVNGVNTVAFNGLDGLGNPIPIWQPMNVKVAINKIGETHFVMSDIEIFGGLTVTRLNGPGAPDNTLYWNDSNLPSGGNCSTTPLINGSGGVNSSGGGVHDWTQCGTCSPPRATCSGTNQNDGTTGSWGDSRLIDNWAYVTDSTLNRTIFIAPLADTTYTSVCDTLLPYIWNGHSYNASGTYKDTLLGATGCDSIATLNLTVLPCAVNGYCDASVIPNTTTPITIDGNVDAAWSKASPHLITKGTVGAVPADFNGTQWQALWDANYLYVMVQVKDAAVMNNNDPNWWDDDAVEIYIDGNNSKNGSYDGVDDFQYGIRYSDPAIKFGLNSVMNATGVSFATTAVAGGYNMEIRIPWTTINATPPTDGRMIGFDVQVDDDDDGGIRNSQVSWNTNSNNAFANPQLFGQLPLATCEAAPLSIIYDHTDPTCAGYNNGTITATGIGGTPPYTYRLTGTGIGVPIVSSTGYYSGLAPGNYVVTVTDIVPNTVSSGTITILPFANPLIVSNDTSICIGSAVQLSVTGGTGGYTWSPATGLNATNLANPIATPSVSTTYVVTSQTLNNLVTNPGFESGNIGFTTQYTYYNTQTISRKTYTVSGNAQDLDQFFSPCSAHGGSGNMMAVDGSDAPNDSAKVWCQTFPVNTGTTYNFSYWMTSLSTDPARAQIETWVNGVPITGSAATSKATAPAGTCSWIQIPYTWNSGAATSAQICLYDRDLTGLGNDFGLDDIFFGAPCPVTDSVRITVDTVKRSSVSASVCQNLLPYNWNGNQYNSTGSYKDTLTSLITGCDSIITLNLTVIPVTTTTINASVCANQLPYVWNGSPYNASGTYKDTVTSVLTGCDSILVLNLTVNPIPTIFAHGINPTCEGVCDGSATVDVVDGTAPYTFLWSNAGTTQTITNLCAGTYTVTVTDANSCAVTNSPAPVPGCFQVKSILVDACTATEQDQEMVFFQVGQNPLNYTSLNVTWPTYVTNFPVDPWSGLCTNQTFIDNANATITRGGRLIAAPVSGILPAGANVVIITSNITNTSLNSFANLADTVYVLFQCANAANNQGHFANQTGSAGPRTLTMNFGSGCIDSVTYRTDSLININGTHGGSAAINNGAYVNFSPRGTAGYFNYGCVIPYAELTAEVTLVAPLKTEPTFNPVAAVCQNATAPVLPTSSTNTVPITGTWSPAVSTATPGTTVYIFTPTAGQCADTTTISITVKPVTNSTKDTAVCQNNLPYVWNGNSLSTTGTYKDTLVNSVGCDSILTLNLTIKNQTTSTTNVSVCAATLPYNWNGTPYNTGGSFVYHTLNAAGCDSAATLNLTILNETTSTTNVSVCAATLPYNWNGTPYSAGGSFVYHTLNAAGCDSAATLNLTILNESVSTTNVSVCAATLPYNWNGTPYNAGGSFVYHTLNAAGCDSAATLNLTILNATTSVTNVSVCAATLPYNWNGTPYNAGGSFVYHTLNAAGCDSAATLNLTILNETTSTTNVSVCAATLPYNWNGTPYNAGGSFVYHTLNAAGCDSAATLNLTILNETTSTTNVSVCAATLPYNWNGTPYNAGGSFVYHTLNAAGCDSAATLNLTILNETTSTTNISVCAANLPYNWNGTPYNAGGSFVYHTLNAAGCDSAATLNLTILNATTSVTNVSVCAATLPYNWNGTPYNAGGSFVYHSLNAAGCDSAATLNLTILNETTSTTNVSVCAATLPYNWNGTPYNAGGSFVYHTLNAAGCDSAATLNLTILNATTSVTNVSVCAATLPYNWNGTPYNTGGSFVYHTLNAAGCDSVATLNLTILNESVSTTNVSVCAATLPYNWNGTPYNAGGSFVYHTLNAAGCDSAATLNLTILNATTSVTNVSVCAATLPYNWNGTPYNAGGSFVYHTLNAAGCDSAATLNLTILNETTSTTNISVCAATLPYNWNGTPYNAGGSFVYQTLNAAGCDSAATLNLTILNESVSTTNVSVCAATLPYNWNGTPYNAGGSFVYHTLNAAGCDSAATLNLTILNATTSVTNVSVCAATLPYNWNGTPYNAGGSFVYHTLNAAGCDSAATLNLTILNATTSVTNVSVCAATLPYNWNGTPYNAGGSFVYHTLNAAGCDSAATLNLTILNETTSTTNISVCAANLPYNWNGTPYNAGGSFVYHTLNAAGCDSTATLNLTILNESVSITNVSVCAATLPYNWNGTPYNASGSFVYHTLNAAGCDSAATLNLTILNETTSTTNISVCAANLPYNWNGTPYNAGGSFVYHTLNAAGCDSTATLNLTILNESVSTTNVSVCPATLPYNWNGTPYNSGGSFVYHTLNAAGCDSAATLNLTILNESVSTTNVSVCAATLPYNWNGTPYNAGGSFVYHTLNAAGCDSAATLNLTILNATTSVTNVSVCAATLPYNWNGTPYNAGGSFVYHTLNAAGCDSTATLNLTILNESVSITNVSVCAATLPYNWNGTPYNADGSFVYHTLNAAGCDSTATLNLTILNETTSTTNVSVCAATLPYNWNGTPYSAGGSFVYHTLNAAGCDSVATLNLTILNESVSTTNVSVCAATLPYNWNGTPYNTGGSFVYHTLNAAGCDSAATLNLTILNATTSTTNVSVCAATLPYNWNGTPYNSGGSFVYHTLNAAGCDSAATLNLTILNESVSITNVSVCAANLPYNWNGTPYNTGGSFVYHTLNAAGCDSAATLNLTILNATTSVTNVSVCAATLPYNWNGTPYNAGGSFVYHTLNAAGCDSAATLNLTILNESVSTTNVSVCAATLPYNWNGTPYNAGGSFVYHTLNAAGCDSAATLNLTILNETTSVTNVSVCAATLPYNWNGTPYNTGGSFVYHTLNAAGCDSTATLNLTILNETTSTTNISVCAANLPYNWNGTPYNAGGSFVYHTLNAAGCDSAATLNLTILNETTSTTNVSVCAATLPYVWNSNSYSIAGSYVYHTTNAAGCDSAATLNLIITNETTSATNVSVCAATLPYVWNGTPYNTAGSYIYHTTNAAGCDSAATLNLVILNATSSTTNIVICAAQLPYTWNSNTYNTAGTYNITLVNTAGCDSVATLNLSINPVVTSTTDITICNSQLPYTWNSNSYATAGSYSVTLTNVAGCDSIATLNLTVNPQLTSTTDIIICNAQLPYSWNSNSYNAAGTYIANLTSAAGCDSIATLNLVVLNETVSITNVSVCTANLPYNWNGTPHNVAGSYVYHTLNAAGCDSAATLNLAILNETTSITNTSVCNTSLPYIWNGNSYNIAGSYIFHTTNAAGCDSAATLNLTILNATTSTTNISVCTAALPYVWNSNSYSTAGTYNVILTNTAGCDSTATLNLTVNPQVTSTTNIAICNAQLPYTWNSNTYNAAGTYTANLTSAAGCDSIATLNLIVNPQVTSTTDITICNAQLPYSWNGNTYNAAGAYTVNLTSAAGCDSIATLNLTVNPQVTSTTDITICNAQLPYSWNGNAYNTAGTYTANLTSAAGCDSIATLNLTVNPQVTSTTDITICNVQLPYSWNGNSYNTAGTYTANLTSAAGCDSIATLNLTVNPQVTSTTDITICNAQLPYSWNGNSYNTAGTYTVNLTSAAGCDSIATLNLTVNPQVTSTTDIIICNAQLPYSWNGNSYNTAGLYNVTLVSITGCDSIATLNLIVLNETISTTNISVCAAALPYVWNGNSYNAAGSYVYHTTNTAGCDSAASLILTVNNATASTTNIGVCPVQLPYIWNGNSYNTAGTYSITLSNANGCDSVATLNLTVSAVSSTTTNTSICPPQLPYLWNGNSYNSAGTYSVTLPGASGCDSVATLMLTVNSITTSTTNTSICSSQIPYTWNGNSYNTAGTYSVTLINFNGCDSIATLNLTVNPQVTSTTDITICNAQLPYSWNGNSYNTAGTYTANLTSAAGCDSIATLNLTVNPQVTSTTDITICNAQLPYSWNGNSYNTAGTYTANLTSAAGCDSIATLNLTVNPQVTSTTDITICNAQLPYSWNGNIYNTAGTYTANLTSAAGCDSIATLNLTVNPQVTSTTDITICNAQLPYSWNGNVYNASGTYTVNLTSAAGCDSIATLNLTVNPQVTSTTDITICNAQLPYSWNGNTYNAAGTYTANLISAAGCDSIATLNLTVNLQVTSNTNINICPPQLPYAWNGNTYNAAGTYTANLISSIGCDSIATLNLTVSPSVTSNTDIAICNGQLPYTWNGNIYNSAGSYSITLVNVAGCDSIANLNLTVNPAVTSTNDLTICNTQLPYTWNGNSYNAAGTYTANLTSAAGCDSIATLNLIVNPQITSTTDITICNAQLPYTWNSNAYNAAGSYNVTLVSATGCDSVATLNLTVNPEVTSTTDVTICNTQLPYTWNGNTYNTAGSYNVTLTSNAGCDSIATLNLIINPQATSTTNINICPPQLPYTWNGNTYVTAGTYSVNLIGSNGCDSVATLELTVNPSVTSTTDLTICNAQLPYSWNGNTYNSAGSYSVMLTNVAGCDSVATLNLTVNNQVTSNTDITICNTQLPYTWNGNSYNAAGTYTANLTSAAGCDSIATLNLTVNPQVTSTTDITICNAQLPYTWNGNIYNTAGTYTANLTSAAGCDSIATLNLTVNPQVTSSTDITICNAQLPYLWNGNSYNTAGTYTANLTSAAGCDSIATLNLTVNPQVTSTTDITICNAQLPYSWNGNTYNAAGTYTVNLTSAAGCDSIATLNLTVNPQVTSTTDITICNAQLPYTWNSNTYNTAGTYTVNLTSAAGCDSIATLNLTVNPQVTSTTDITICNTQLPYSWNGNSYNAAGTYTANLTSTAGCDSIATLNLTVNPQVTSSTDITICNAQLPYSWNGNIYNTAGIYTANLTSAAGCDSIATLNLTVNLQVTSNTNINICPPQLPYAWNGNTYNTAGTYTANLTSAAGCDSIATLNLTVNPQVTSTTDITICNAQLPYSWNGNIYNTAGTYTANLTSAAGCDSIATLNLTVNPQVTSTTEITICNAQLPYSWNGNSYNAAGTYTANLISAAGCDSIATLNLTVNPQVTSNTDINICPPQLPYSWNGNTYNAAGTYSVNLISNTGCDSIATINLTVTPSVTSTTDVTICNAQLPYTWNGNSYNAAGSYNVTLTNVAGCDSIATLNLTANPEVTSITEVSVCAALLPYTWNGNTYNSAGSYIYHTTNAVGCDSAATLNLIVLTETTSVTDVSICTATLPYLWNGNTYNTAGSYIYHTTNAVGCDSAATLNLVILNETTSSTAITICPAQLPYTWNGNTYNAAGTYTAKLTNANGCDSVATLNLTVNAVVTSSTNISICNAQLPYVWNSNTYNAAGSYNVTLINIAGCDSIATLNLIVKNEVTSTTNVSVCPAQLPYTWNGNSYSTAGSYIYHTTNIAGCDSAATLNLVVLNETTSITNISVCAASLPYTWNGNTYNAAGAYIYHTINAAGCDSAATLNLTILNETTSTTNVSVCAASLPYTWNGKSYTAAGTYTYHTTNAAGCDSAASLILTVLNATSSNTSFMSICKSSLPYVWNGKSYTASGIYTYNTTNAAGCDSTATLNLTVNDVVTSTTEIKICDAQLPYTWNGKSYSAAGTYVITLTSYGGCDSLATLQLNTVNAVTQTTNITGCNSVIFNGTTYTSSRVFEEIIKSIGGCDSIQMVTNLTVTHEKFDVAINAIPNPPNKGDVVKLTTTSTTPYSVTAWEPAELFAAQNAITQQMVADTSRNILVTAKSTTGCIAKVSFRLNVKDPSDFWMPNAFTPNEDGSNDFFSAYGTTIKQGLLRIYNQWGQLLYETTDIKRGWDGKYKGVPQPVGVYAYVVFAEMYNGSKVTDKGFLNLIR